MALPGVPMGGGDVPPEGFRFIRKSNRSGGTGAGDVRIQIEGLEEIRKALREMGGDAPYLRAALERVGVRLAAEMESVMPHQSFKVGKASVKGRSPNLRAVVPVDHPGARAYEFGRKWYYAGFTGRKMKATGYKIRSAVGQKARPYLGIIEGSPVAEKVRPYAIEQVLQAYDDEWDRLTSMQGYGEGVAG